jgi:replicative DNA helicase
MTETLARIPPHNLNAERAILGCCLLEGARAVAQCPVPEAFYLEEHRVLAAALRGLADQGRDVSILTVEDQLRELGQLEAAGGPAHLALCLEEASIEAYLPRYVDIVQREAARREAIQACTTAIGMLFGTNGHEPAEAVGDVAAALTDRLTQLAGQADHSARAVPILEVVDEVRAYLDMPAGRRQMVRTPIPELNQRLGGGTLHGELLLVGGRPGTSKTSLMLQWAALAAQDGHRTLVISREMRTLSLGRRFIAQQLRIPASSLRKVDLWDHERSRLEAARERLGAIPLWFADQAVTIGHIRRLTRLLAPRLLLVDYVQLVESPADARAGKRLEVTAVSRALKRLATQGAGCSVIALSSLRRLGPEGAKGKKAPPTLDDLKESGDLEADADVVVLLWQKGEEGRDRELTFAKVRDGAGGGTITLDWDPTFVQFSQIAPDTPPARADREPGSDDVPF